MFDIDRPSEDDCGNATGGNVWLVSWDQLGLECLFNFTEYDKLKTWYQLSDKPLPSTVARPPPLQVLLLRARYNAQRHYEIYTFTADTNITYEDLKLLFDEYPQYIVDMIRERGNAIHSDRASQDVVIR